MAEPTLKIKQDESGGKRVQDSLKKTSEGMYEAARASREVTSASHETRGAFGGAAASAGIAGAAFVAAANHATDLAAKAMAAAGAIVDFAKAGANAADIGARYNQLGSAVATLDALKRATANAVDETSLQAYAMQAQAIGLTASEAEAAARSVTVLSARQGKGLEVAKNLNEVLKGSAEKFRELGLVIDAGDAKFKGLSETTKKLAFVKELTTAATEEELAAIESQTLAIAQAKTTWDDMLSNMQVFAAELVTGSGALEGFKSIMAEGQRVLADNRENISRIVDVIAKMASTIATQALAQLERLAVIFGTVLDVLAPAIELLADANEQFAKIPDVLDIASAAFDAFTSAVGSAKGTWVDLAGAVLDANKAVREVSVTMGDFDPGGSMVAKADDLTESWEAQIRAGEDLEVVMRSIVFAGGSLAETNKLLAELGNQFSEADFSSTLWDRFDALLVMTDEHFAKAGKSAAKAKEEVRDLGVWIDSVSYRLTGYTPETMWTHMQREADEAEKRSIRSVRRVRDAFMAAARETKQEERRAAAERQTIAEQQLALRKELFDREAQAARDSRDAITGAALDSARAIGSQTAAFLGGGWARAGFEAAFETGLGIANLFTPPSFGAEHFAAAAQLLIAQAFAESNGASGSKSSGGGAGAARPAAAAQAIVQRPDVATNGAAAAKITQLWIKDTKLAEAVEGDLGAAVRLGRRAIPVDAIGGSARRAIG